jgi:hypothetical protein
MIETGGDAQPGSILISHKFRADFSRFNLGWIGKHGWEEVSGEAMMDSN